MTTIYHEQGFDEDKYFGEQPNMEQDYLRWLESQYKTLSEVKEAAQIIFDVTSKSSSKAYTVECPHGNLPAYPTHAWWCDQCWYRLQSALESVGKIITKVSGMPDQTIKIDGFAKDEDLDEIPY